MRLSLLLMFLFSVQISIAQIFVEETTTPFAGVEASSVKFADVDGDNDLDVVVSGQLANNTRITKLYTNDGVGVFTEVANTPFMASWFSKIAFIDIDGDNAPDLLLSGRDASNTRFTKLYSNDGTGAFTENTNSTIQNIAGAIAVADVDNDGDEDFVIGGQIASGASVTALYLNDGNGVFTEAANTSFDGVYQSDAVFGDVDGDNDQDLIIAGNSTGSNITKLYKNDGAGVFTEATTNIEGVSDCSIVLGDINGDAHLDLVVSGFGPLAVKIVIAYTNDGTGIFTELTGNNFEGVRSSSMALGDYDKDGDNDLVVTGLNDAFQSTSKLYTNDGTGSFTEDTNESLEGVYFSSVAVADIDGDSDLDLMVTGSVFSSSPVTKLYRNALISTSTEEVMTTNESASIRLFPNPTENITYVYLDAKESGNRVLNVYSINGTLVQQFQQFVNEGKVKIPLDVSHLAKGVYMIEVTGKEYTKGVKLIVK